MNSNGLLDIQKYKGMKLLIAELKRQQRKLKNKIPQFTPC